MEIESRAVLDHPDALRGYQFIEEISWFFVWADHQYITLGVCRDLLGDISALGVFHNDTEIPQYTDDILQCTGHTLYRVKINTNSRRFYVLLLSGLFAGVFVLYTADLQKGLNTQVMHLI